MYMKIDSVGSAALAVKISRLLNDVREGRILG
jgi:hypothetical protein